MPSQPNWQGMPSQPGIMASGPISQPSTHDPVSGYPAWQSAPGTAPRPVEQPTAPPPPPTAFQQWLVRTFQPSLAGNAVFGILLGAIVAVVAGALISILLVAISNAVAPHYSVTNGFPIGQDILGGILGITPLHAPFRDGMQLFFLMHGAGEHLQYTSGGSISTYDYNAVLNGLLFIPALVLVLGGYIAASTDLQHRPKSSLLRGIAVALPYAVLLLILAQSVNGNVPLNSSASPSDTYTISMDSTSLFLYGLICGVIFGTLGASLKLGRGQWRKLVMRYLSSRPMSRVVGMITGGLAAAGLGIALSLLVLLSILAYSAFSVPLFASSVCASGGLADWQFMGGWAIAQGPLHAVNLFFYSFGAPLTINNPHQFYQPCFYTSRPQLVLSMFGGSPHLPSWTYALLAIPVLSLFLGGRISAAFGKAQGGGQGAVQGAMIALPFTVLMMLLSVYTMLNYHTSSSNGNSSSTGTTIITQSFGVGAFDLLLWALLSSALLGGLGGMYQTGTMKTSISKMLAGLAAPLRGLGAPGIALMNRLRGLPRSSPRTTALRLAYGAAFAMLVLIVIVVGTSICFIVLNQTISYALNYRVRDILAVVLVALPGLLLICAGAAALAEEKIPRPPAAVNPAPPTTFPPFQPQSHPDYRGGF